MMSSNDNIFSLRSRFYLKKHQLPLISFFAVLLMNDLKISLQMVIKFFSKQKLIILLYFILKYIFTDCRIVTEERRFLVALSSTNINKFNKKNLN